MNITRPLVFLSYSARLADLWSTYHLPVEWTLGVSLAPAVAGAMARFRLGRAWSGLARPDSRRASREVAVDPEEQLTRLACRSLDSLRVGLVVLDAEDRPILVNPAARALGLLRAGAGLGNPVAHPAVRTLAGRARRTGVPREAELDLSRDPAAAAIAVNLRAVNLGDDFVAIEAQDMTEAHRVARVRRDFVANVSHELKTPIGALQLLSEALLDATDAGPARAGEPAPAGEPARERVPDIAAARRFADRIHHESRRLGRLVTELIELSRLQGGDPLPAPEPVGVDSIVAEVLDRTRTAAGAKGTEIEVTGERGLIVYGSDQQLATAVVNLVENALAYSPPGSPVTLATSATDELVDIAVTDEGIGIAPKDVDRVFERFYRADRARSRATGGTGLGLAIVKQIATNHGGRVEVASELGKGSTFTLRLPARPQPAVPPAPAAPKGSA